VSPDNPWLVCGVAGTGLADDERRLLGELRPGGVVLFARNVAGREQLAALVAELADLPSRPYVAIDLEGGRVNRLDALLGPLPSAAAAEAAGGRAVAALGAALGAACAHFRIGVDFAPVLDAACPDGFLAGEQRCLGASASEAARAAAALLGGLEVHGVAGCLKHYPGLGSGRVDSHRELPVLEDGVVDEEAAFRLLATAGRAVMVAHAVAPALGDALRPASLSPVVVGRLAASACGPVIADDLEMGALAAYGSLGERAAAALLAGCDQVLVCNALGERAAVVEHLRRWAGRDARLSAALGRTPGRVAGFGRGLLAPVSWDEARRAAADARGLAGSDA
jgi:beta-N-acetylhexosaminidase